MVQRKIEKNKINLHPYLQVTISDGPCLVWESGLVVYSICRRSISFPIYHDLQFSHVEMSGL